VAVVRGKRPLFFTSSGFTSDARRFAAQTEVALFRIAPEAGTLEGLNSLGEQIREGSLA
jgi:hypothetical protein